MKIVIASHGRLSEGIKNSLEMIVGEKENIETIAAYVEEEKDYSEVFKNVIEDHCYDSEDLLVLTDLFGGSVNNEFMKYINDYNFYLVSGVNLPLLLEFSMMNEIDKDVINEVISNCKSNVRFCNEINLEVCEDESF